MGELISEARSATSVFNGGLLVGNHDAIAVFGLEQQNALRKCSRRLSALMREDRNAAFDAMKDVLSEMDDLEKRASKRPLFPFSRNASREDDLSLLCDRIEDVAAQLEVQQAQIAKENELLKRMDTSLQQCDAELGKLIEKGRHYLSDAALEEDDGSFERAAIGESGGAWLDRFGKRIDELTVSRMAVSQTRAQISILLKNNLNCLDEISHVVFNLVALCRNRLTGKAGTDLRNARLEVCESFLKEIGVLIDDDLDSMGIERNE